MKAKSFASVVLLCGLAFGQADETVTIKKSDLTKDQLDKVAAAQLQEKIDRYGKWVGSGHEIGVAVNESLSAITNNAQTFSQTTPGKLTMFLVVYKVIGRDILGLLVSAVMLIVGLPFWIWSYRKYVPQNHITDEYDDVVEGKTVTHRKFAYGYGMVPKNDCEGWLVAHWAILGVFVVVALMCIF